MTTPEDISKEKAKKEREIHNRRFLIGGVVIVVGFIIVIGVIIGLVTEQERKRREIAVLRRERKKIRENGQLNNAILSGTIKDPPLVHNVCDKVACNADMRNWISNDDNVVQFKFDDTTVGNCKYCERRAYRSPPFETSLDGGLTWQTNADKLSAYNTVAYVI